eukprot:CAMPEP_0114236940 /NCGR_PEP_ID=MMETSP0058-20121206/7120_1 /TAXON_ID=36894 /ORGANISM="Pyramimonas parkeae, CCMP726" /LENGTH=305 /DNA_ID=CAMNT_0001348939 /DNA_START=140 /DNA_END=1057 /DNA_ORIENTATION=-
MNGSSARTQPKIIASSMPKSMLTKIKNNPALIFARRNALRGVSASVGVRHGLRVVAVLDRKNREHLNALRVVDTNPKGKTMHDLETLKSDCREFTPPTRSSDATCRIPRERYNCSQVPVFDLDAEEVVMCTVSAYATPDKTGFQQRGEEVWTLDLRLESNSVKIGDLVLRLSPSVEGGDLEDATICSILNFDTQRFRGVGTALVSHMVHGAWRSGHVVKLDQVVAESVETRSLTFWYNMGFRFSKGSEEEGHYDGPEALDLQMQSVIDDCQCCSDMELSQCVTEQAYRITGSNHEMSCTVREYWQ